MQPAEIVGSRDSNVVSMNGKMDRIFEILSILTSEHIISQTLQPWEEIVIMARTRLGTASSQLQVILKVALLGVNA